MVTVIIPFFILTSSYSLFYQWKFIIAFLSVFISLYGLVLYQSNTQSYLLLPPSLCSSGNKDEPMETDPVSQPSIEEEEEHSKEDEEQQAIEGDEPVDDNMETESSASHEHKTTPSTDVTSNNTKKKDKDLPPPATRQMRGNRTTPTNKRARRANAKPEEEGKADEDLSGSATTSGNETETDDKGKVKAGKGRGRGASRQNPKDPKTEQSNTPEDSLVKGPARKGGAGAQSYSAAYRVTRATAAAAGKRERGNNHGQ